MPFMFSLGDVVTYLGFLFPWGIQALMTLITVFCNVGPSCTEWTVGRALLEI